MNAASPEASPTRARVLSGNGVLAHYQGDYELWQGHTGMRSARSCARRRRGHRRGVHGNRARATDARGLSGRRDALSRGAGRLRGPGRRGGVARALDRLAVCLVVGGEMDRARPLFEQSLGLFRRLGDSHGVALGLYGLAATRPAGGLAAARSYADESLDILRAVGDRRLRQDALGAATSMPTSVTSRPPLRSSRSR